MTGGREEPGEGSSRELTSFSPDLLRETEILGHEGDSSPAHSETNGAAAHGRTGGRSFSTRRGSSASRCWSRWCGSPNMEHSSGSAPLPWGRKPKVSNDAAGKALEQEIRRVVSNCFEYELRDRPHGLDFDFFLRVQRFRTASTQKSGFQEESIAPFVSLGDTGVPAEPAGVVPGSGENTLS